MTIEYLSWDSDFFNKKIGKILYDIQNENILKELLAKAKTENYDLLYIFAPENLFIENDILKTFSGKLIDRKVLYSQHIDSKKKEEETQEIISTYSETDLTKELEELAYLSGQYSRFLLDKNFDSNDFYKLYKTWITKSLTKEMADKVFVIKEKEKIVGMATLKYEENFGDIGLIAVSETVQEKGYGKKLINACISDLSNNGIYQIEVPTQLDNLSACRFYEKCGFEIKTITNIYHFWL
ncbi:MAG: GNAT family N-acetyltransferase [Bacteroidales bacterium]|jgi:dTDP-4-amino-4,6-dideoxy-D-galactose acyltransferase|nr:GNAT family N-acetyltransferase [Bacteroidales bacterium]